MASEAPEALIWIITGACNLRCPYCYASRYMGEAPLPPRVVAEVLREAGDAGTEYVQFTGGEPLLYRGLLEVLEAAVDAGMEATVFTNLTIMDERVAGRLAAVVSKIYTSLDGPRGVYEAVKGPGSWERFLRGVAAVRGAGVPLHVNIPLSRLNYRCAGEAVRLAAEMGADTVSVIPAMPAGRALETRSFIGGRELLEALRRVDEAASELGVTVAAWCMPWLRFMDYRAVRPSGNCRDWSVMDVTPSGNVVYCDVLGTTVANIVQDGVKGAWEKVRSHPLARLTSKPPAACSRCPHAAWCRGGCYARAAAAYGRVDAPDPLCPLAPGAGEAGEA